MSGFNLPPGVTTLPGEETTWEEMFERSPEYEGLPREAKKRWENRGKPLAKVFGAIMGWAWGCGEADAGMSHSIWLSEYAIPKAAAILGIDAETLYEALHRKPETDKEKLDRLDRETNEAYIAEATKPSDRLNMRF